MKNINWTVRRNNKVFWVTFIPAVIVLVKCVASVFGFTLDLNELGDKLVDVVDAVFVILGILGIVVDPTTEGVSDSTQAQSYRTPQ